MATNKVQPGNDLQLTLTLGAASGGPCAVGSITGVALETITAGGTGTVDRKGVYDLPVWVTAVGGFSIGQALYFQTADKTMLTALTHTHTTTLFGYALEAITTSGGTSTTINVLQKADA